MNKILDYINTADYIDLDKSFEIATYCSKLLSSSNVEKQNSAQRLIIHALNNLSKFNADSLNIWADLVESIGFYPYIQKNKDMLKLTSISDIIRKETHLSPDIDTTYFHSEQKILYSYILDNKSVVASAPTSFGKSLLIEEIVASRKHRNIVIIQPTLALLDETRLKMIKYNEHYKIIVRTSQQPSEEKGNLFLLTAERVLEYQSFPKIDFLVIDEFYKLSLKRDDSRVDALNNAFLKIHYKYNCKFYFLGPNIDGISIGFAEKFNAIFYKSNYSLVDCEVINLYKTIDQTSNVDKQKEIVLFNLLDSLKDEQTIIYCKNPDRARKYAKKYASHLIKNNVSKIEILPLIEWINQNISSNWSLSSCLEYGIAIHDGSLQKHIATSVIRYFNNRKLKYIFCTSTIIEGVNTSAKNVVFFDNKKGGKDIDFFDYSNIKGRSGRLMEHYVGKIFNIDPPPQRESIIIDIPFVEQINIPDEILINIQECDVHNSQKDKHKELYDGDPKLIDILKHNGVSIIGQKNILKRLSADIYEKYSEIAWTQYPKWDQLKYILEISEINLYNFDFEQNIRSPAQLAYYVDKYKRSKSIFSIVEDIFIKKKSSVVNLTAERVSNYYDQAIEAAFHIYRHWFQFTVPKTIRVVDSLQRYVCESKRLKPGSYTFFVQQLENDFIKNNLTILSEFGIPNSAINKLSELIDDSLSEDEIIEYIKKNSLHLHKSLIKYEQDKVLECL